jgi:membrane-associated phospholipid phosphatase
MRFVSTVLLAIFLSPSLVGQFRDSRSGNSTEPLGADSAGTACRSSSTPYIIGGAAVLTAICLANDQQLYDRVYSWRRENRTVDRISPIVTEMGSGGFAVAVTGAFGAYGYLADDDLAFEVGKIGLESFIATGIATQLLKQLFSRERPETSTRPGGFWAGPFAYFRQPGGKKHGFASYDAFPSGHTTTAFSVATTFADVYDDRPWVGYLSYSLATIVAVSRITESAHWASDCVVGAVIGTYGTKFVESLNAPSSDVSLLPTMSPDSYGFLVSVRL